MKIHTETDIELTTEEAKMLMEVIVAMLTFTPIRGPVELRRE